MDLDELLGDGVELPGDVVVKAQLRVRVRPPAHPVAQHLCDQLVSAYDERLGMICEEIDEILRSEEPSAQLVFGADDVVKAGQHVYAPGARGGKWYRDGQGHIRYGEPPTGGRQPGAKKPEPVSGEGLSEHIGHLRPGSFMGTRGVDHELTDFLLSGGGRNGFKPGQLRFLGSWFGTGTRTGALLDAFLDCTGLTRQDLKGDIELLRFGSQQLTFEEAVFEFFAAQENLFMGDEDGEEGDGEDWDTVLNEQIKPALDNVFGRYEALKQDPEFHAKVAGAAGRRVREFFSTARESVKETNVANHITGNPDPSRQVDAIISGMMALGLFRHQPHADASAHARGTRHLHGRPHLDERLLVDDPKRSPLLAARDRLGELTASQLMLTYIAVEMCRRFDSETGTYSDEDHADKGHGVIGQAVLDALVSKHEKWSDAIDLVKKDLCKVVDRVVSKLNADAEADE